VSVRRGSGDSIVQRVSPSGGTTSHSPVGRERKKSAVERDLHQQQQQQQSVATGGTAAAKRSTNLSIRDSTIREGSPSPVSSSGGASVTRDEISR
jgi:hypothetical protein